MTNFDALKAIYEALGGEEAISGTNLDALKAIAEVAGSGGGGGGDVLVATFTYDPTTETTTCDKTFAEIRSQFQSGTPALFRYAQIVEGELFVFGSGVMDSYIYEEAQYYGGCAVIYNFAPVQGNLQLDYVKCDISESEVSSQLTHIPAGQ